MKKQFLKIAGVTSEAAFYKKYPTEAAFFAAHPEARKMAMGGTPEAYPQIATFDNAFSYGVKPGPQYLAHGGSAYPQAQTEAQFFVPIYTDVYNPYNKAMGGSNVEMYPNAKKTPHWGPTNVWFQDGGQEGMPQQQDGQDLDRLGAQNRTGAFATILKQTAHKANAKNAMMGAMNNMGMAKYGKQLNKYQGDKDGSQTTTTPPAYLTKEDLNNWWKSVSQSQYPMYPMYPGYPGYYPGYADPTGNMSNFLDDYFAYTTSGRYPGSTTRGRVTVDGQRAGKFYGNMPLIKAMYPELYGKGNFEDLMKNNADFRNRAEALGLTSYKEPTGLKRLFGSREYTFNQRVPWEAPTVTLDPNQTPPTSSGKEVPPLLKDDPSYRTEPQAPGYTNPMDKFMPSAPADSGIKIPYAPNPAPTTSSNQSSQTGVTQPAANTVPAFDQSGVFNQISSNEQNFFGTKGVNEILGPSASQNWQDYPVQNYDQSGNKKGAPYDTGDKVKANWERLLADDPNKKAQWEAFKDMPAPIKAIAQDQLFNSSFDPRVIALAAAGVDQGYTGKGAPVLSNKEYRSWLKNNADSLWSKNKDLINQQYNDDPQAFTETVSANRDIAYQKTRTPDENGQLTDFPSSSGGPGTQYPAWSGRTKATQDYVDKTYFNPSTGYVAPQFFQNAATTTTKRQAPSNTNSKDDAATRQKKASYQKPNVNQAYIDAQRAAAAQNSAAPASAYSWSDMSTTPTRPDTEGIYTTDYLGTEPANNPPLVQISPSFTTDDYTQFMPQMTYNAGPLNTVGPREGFGYGGYTGYKFGGAYKQGDVVYMSDDEIAEFIRNGGQIEEME